MQAEVAILYRKSPRTAWEFITYAVNQSVGERSADSTLTQQRALGDKHGEVIVVEREAYDAGAITKLYKAKERTTP